MLKWRRTQSLRECLTGGGDRRPRRRQRYHLRDLDGRLAHVPRADAIALPALGEIEMDMTFVMAVRAGPEHRGEALAGARAQGHAQIFCDRHVGQADHAAVGERKRTHVYGVAHAVLADLGAEHPVTAAAFEVVIIVDTAQDGADRVQARRRFVADPGGERFRHLTAQYRSCLLYTSPSPRDRTRSRMP